jgi:uncharacterized protein
MRNIPGSPVEGGDFFDRPEILSRLHRLLENQSNVLLTAPRRVGKTSVILRLCEQCRQQGWKAVFFNVEGCGDELAFAEKLVSELHRADLNPDAMTRMALGFQRIRAALKGMKFGAGIDVEMGDPEDPECGTLGRAIESALRKVDEDGQMVLIAIDELPELLLTLSKQDHGSLRVERLLHWLRELRQTYRRRIRWVFLGSIGLDGFVEGRNLGKTINDLTPASLGALTPEEADRFLETLGNDNNLPIPPEIRALIVERVGWPLPHHLQVMFHALVDSGATEATTETLKEAFAFLLRPENLSQFDTWRQRLDEQFATEDAVAAKDILKHLCQHTDGRSRRQILNALMSARPDADPGKVEDQLARLLLILQRDGYLLESDGRYSFRSFLLREFWNRREVR